MAGIGRRCTLPLIMQDGLIAEQRGPPPPRAGMPRSAAASSAIVMLSPRLGASPLRAIARGGSMQPKWRASFLHCN
jgi:hypothetical protein